MIPRFAGWLTVALLAIGAGGAIGNASARWKEVDLLQRADRFIERREWIEAAAVLRSVLRARPEADDVRLKLAEILRRSDPGSALRELQWIRETSPEFLKAARVVAALNLELGRDYDALAPLQRLRLENPRDAGVCQALAEIEFRAGHYESSLALSREARSLDPANVSCCLLEADACDNLHRTSEMIAPLQAALALGANLPQAQLNLAYALERSGDPAAALPHAIWFLERQPDSVAGLRTLATIQLAQGEFEQGLRSIRRALSQSPVQLECRIVEAELLLSLNQALEGYQRLKELDETWGFEPRYLQLAVQCASEAGLSGIAGELQSRWSRISP